jgi:site-specific DNA-methyltransferase (adenine-specific)
MKYQILHGDNRETLKTLPDNSIDAIVTDPPYGIDFLGKAWDANTGALETYQECLRVLKPGGHIVAFSAARTYHHLAVTLEQAGFEIRDQIMWIYSSGFPKSQDVGRSIQRSIGVEQTQDLSPWENSISRLSFDNAGEKVADTQPAKKVVCTDPEALRWEGWGTALKPGHEPIALARKPMKLSIAKNCQAHGVGALNIDATRIPYEDQKDIDTYLNNKRGPMERAKIKDGENIGMFDGEVGYKAIKREVTVEQDLPEGRFPSNVLGDIPDYQKYFYCPKVSRAERHIGMADVKSDPQTAKKGNGIQRVCETCGTSQMQAKDCHCATKSWVMPAVNGGNNHPTVKPIELMKYLIRLITPPGGTVLDPFTGSGSTGCAAVELGMEYIGCELDANYVEIARRRIEAWYEHVNPTTYNQIFEQE